MRIQIIKKNHFKEDTMKVLKVIFMSLFMISGAIIPGILMAETTVSQNEVKVHLLDLNNLEDAIEHGVQELLNILERALSKVPLDNLSAEEKESLEKAMQELRDAKAEVNHEFRDAVISQEIIDALRDLKIDLKVDENATIKVIKDTDNQIIINALKDTEQNTDTQKNHVMINIRNTAHTPNGVPYLGVASQDLTLPKATTMNYEHNHGVLITRVFSNSPARASGLAVDDILMSIDDVHILSDSQFSNVLGRFFTGDTVTLKIFRDGQVMEVDTVLGSRGEDTSSQTVSRKTSSVDVQMDIGGSWYPIWFHEFNVADINKRLTDFGFSELSKDGILFHGGGGKIGLGKGYLLGAMGAGYTIDRKKNFVIENDNDEMNAVTRRYQYTASFWGISLDKRYAIGSRFLVSPGFMVGGGHHRLNLVQTTGDYNWDNFDSQLYSCYNFYESLNKSYIIVQPRFEMMYKVRWLGLRAEVGYLYGFSPYNGWKNTLIDDVFEVSGSPNTTFEGFTFSIGPWFEF